MAPNEHREQLAASLEATLPIQTLATLTFPGRMAVDQASRDTHFTEFIHGVQATTHQTIGYIRADETTERPHLHVALVAAGPVPEPVVISTWHTVTGCHSITSCVAQTFVSGGGGISYLLKDGEYGFSDNLHLFKAATDPADLSRGDRRTFHRIHQHTTT